MYMYAQVTIINHLLTIYVILVFLVIYRKLCYKRQQNTSNTNLIGISSGASGNIIKPIINKKRSTLI